MTRTGDEIVPLEWLGDRLRLLDQTLLPGQERYLEVRDAEGVAKQIRRLAVRGAPLLGVAAGFGLALAAQASGARTSKELLDDLGRAATLLVASRPTAVNLAWAVERVTAAALASEPDGWNAMREAAIDEARLIAEEDRASCLAIGALGAELVPAEANVLTHCNAGALATGGIGTAVGVIRVAHEQGKRVHVWVGETRPVLQGARLTSWELQRLRIPMTLVADTAPGSLMASGLVDLVVVGADRIAANGDVANKVGTYQLAVLSLHHGIPFYVAAPASTVDLGVANGDGLVIERRDPREVSEVMGARTAPEGTWAMNPAFDVTPASMVTAIVTDRGVARPPYDPSLRELLSAESAPQPTAPGGGRP
jgi:methylthioribose-1-phosphate isomerase